MLEPLGAVVLFVLAYPANVVTYGLEQPAQMLGWFIVGVGIVVLLTWFGHRNSRRAWIALWFMPGAIICGAAALLPWPFAVWAHFGPGNCVTTSSLLIAATVNLVVVFAFAEVWHWFRRRRGPHKVLKGGARKARA